MYVREDFTTCIEFLLESQAYYAINVKNMSVMNMFVLSNKLFERERGRVGEREIWQCFVWCNKYSDFTNLFYLFFGRVSLPSLKKNDHCYMYDLRFVNLSPQLHVFVIQSSPF